MNLATPSDQSQDIFKLGRCATSLHVRLPKWDALKALRLSVPERDRDYNALASQQV